MKIEEILGFTSSVGKDAETISKRYYVKCGPNEGPDTAQAAFQTFAEGLPVPADMERSAVGLEEDKNVNGLYYGTVTFKSPSPKIKRKIADDLEELCGESYSEDRTSGTHARKFRIRSDSAKAAFQRLNDYIRATATNSGRLHIGDISVDESESDDGWYNGKVSYSNPSNKGPSDEFEGILPGYGERITANQDSLEFEHIYELRGYANARAALEAVSARYDWRLSPEIEIDEDGSGADRYYTARVRLSSQNDDTQEDETFTSTVQFDIGSSSQKVRISKMTRGRYAPPGRTTPNYGGLINVTTDSVEGVDLPFADGSFTETHHFTPATLNAQTIAFLMRSFGVVNTNQFRGFAPGEVRFLGASGAYEQGDRSCPITFRFGVSSNTDELYVGEIGPISKRGWDYIWVRYEDTVDEASKTLSKKPTGVYVEQVFDEIDFSAFGIG